MFFNGASLSDSTGVHLLIEVIDKRIEDAKKMKDKFLPARAKSLQAKINNLSRTVGQLYIRCHRSLQDRIAFDRKQRLLDRLKANLVGIADQQKMWKHVVEKAKEGRKQAQRLLKVQDEDEGVDRRKGTEAARRLEISTARAMKATNEYKQALAVVEEDLEKMNGEIEYQKKAGKVDRKAYLQAKAKRMRDKLPKAKIDYLIDE